MTTKFYSVLIVFVCTTTFLFGQEYALIPYPNSVTTKEGVVFQLNKSSVIYFSDSSLKKNAIYLQKILGTSTGYILPVKKLVNKEKEGDVILSIKESENKNTEAYSLDVSNGIVSINSIDGNGVFYGIQTLLQLFPVAVFEDSIVTDINWAFPAVSIFDSPKFKWRGMHLDVGRNFKSVAFVKKFIDQLSHHKMNSFHWHLTEDQGWRIQIKKYPKLTEIGAWRDSTLIGHTRDIPKRYKVERTGGFYTQEEIIEVVEYAKDRYINIVPEIEMPGHAQAAIAAYPEFGMTGVSPGVRPLWGISKHIYSPEDKTIGFLKDVLDEVMLLFPSEYIHIGGDEAKKNQWESSERVKELLKERGLHDMHEMQSWFVQQIGAHLADNNRTLIGWDEILEGGLADGAAVMSWRGNKGAVTAAKQGSYAVVANAKSLYFSKYQSRDKENEPLAYGGFIPLEKVYAFNPIPEELSSEEAKFILGAQGQIWTEFIVEESKVEYMMFPRACALSEVVWSSKGANNYKDFLKRLEIHLKRLKALEVNYRTPDELIK